MVSAIVIESKTNDCIPNEANIDQTPKEHLPPQPVRLYLPPRRILLHSRTVATRRFI